MEKLTPVMTDIHLALIEDAASRLTPGNVAHNGAAIVALVRALRNKLDLKRNRRREGVDRG